MIGTDSDTHAKRVKHQLPMGKINPFRVSGGTAGVKRCGFVVFIQIGKFVGSRSRLQQLLIPFINFLF
jgi:hypothetical protein